MAAGLLVGHHRLPGTIGIEVVAGVGEQGIGLQQNARPPGSPGAQHSVIQHQIDPRPRRQCRQPFSSSTAKGVASIFGGGLAAILFQQFGSWSAPFYGSAALALTAGLMALWLRVTPLPRKAVPAPAESAVPA